VICWELKQARVLGRRCARLAIGPWTRLAFTGNLTILPLGEPNQTCRAGDNAGWRQPRAPGDCLGMVYCKHVRQLPAMLIQACAAGAEPTADAAQPQLRLIAHRLGGHPARRDASLDKDSTWL
jgi:hypothetical protein